MPRTTIVVDSVIANIDFDICHRHALHNSHCWCLAERLRNIPAENHVSHSACLKKYAHGCVAFCFVVVMLRVPSRLVRSIYPYTSGLLHWYWGNRHFTWWRHQRKHFPRYWPFVRGIHRSPVNSPHKEQWRGALVFTLICTRINGWVNNLEVLIIILQVNLFENFETTAFCPGVNVIDAHRQNTSKYTLKNLPSHTGR